MVRNWKVESTDYVGFQWIGVDWNALIHHRGLTKFRWLSPEEFYGQRTLNEGTNEKGCDKNAAKLSTWCLTIVLSNRYKYWLILITKCSCDERKSDDLITIRIFVAATIKRQRAKMTSEVGMKMKLYSHLVNYLSDYNPSDKKCWQAASQTPWSTRSRPKSHAQQMIFISGNSCSPFFPLSHDNITQKNPKRCSSNIKTLGSARHRLSW